MIIKPRYKRQIVCIGLLSIILIAPISALIFSTDFSNSPAIVNEDNGDLEEVDDLPRPIEQPKASILGNDTWWDQNWEYRRIINVTNPYAVKFTDFGVKLVIDYTQFGGRIKDNLDDIRIIEYFNGKAIERNYFVEKNQPYTNYATVWFDNNITEGPNHSEMDTYLYYGNDAADNGESRDVLESFGYVRNGDFEYHYEDETKFIPYGWNFTDDPIDTIKNIDLDTKNIPNEPYNNTEILGGSYEQFVYRLIDDELGWHGLGNGDYAYKWGNPANSLPNTQCFDYVGTLYSYPFTVPYVEGGDISLKLWRNVLTYIFMPSNTDIDFDGYYIRLCNGSAPKYTSNVDAHEDIGTGYNNYLEAYGGNAKFAARWRQEYDLREHHALDIKDTEIQELTGYVDIDLSDYMGEEIFLEFGSWGRENGDRTATNDWRAGFFQLDDVKFNYTLTATIDELQVVDNQVTVVAVDVDGRVVPNVDIFLVNHSAREQPGFIVNSSTAATGVKTFTNVPRGRYNITANYTLASGKEVEVFNSSQSGDGPYYFNGINYTVQIQLNIWTIDFEIVDWDGIPVKYGYLEINESKGTNWLTNIQLDENGKGTFRWLNAPSYYYKAYYDNDDYSQNPIPLNESYIYRSAYTSDDVKYTHHSIWVNNTQVDSFSVSKRIYTNYSNDIENKKIIKANITLTNMENYLTDVSIYYIDGNNLTGTGNNNRIYYETYDNPPDIKDDFIKLDISLIDNEFLKSDNFEVYGLLLVVNGYNSSVDNDGIIQVDLIETCNVYNKTSLARINIKTIYFNELTDEFDPVGAFVKVSSADIDSLVNLTSNSNAISPLEDGYAYAVINEVPFWFLRGKTYNFTIDIANLTNVNFNLTYTSDNSQWIPGSGEKISKYNFTLWENSSLTFNIIPDVTINFTKFSTKFNESYSTGSVYWGGNILIWAIFLSTEDNWATWSYVNEPPGECRVLIMLAGTEDIIFNLKMSYTGSNGNYTRIFDSGRLSAGSTSKNYIFKIQGNHPTFENPTPEARYVENKAIPTTIQSYNYDTRAVITNNYYYESYNEFVKMTVAYNISASGFALTDGTVSYSWSFGIGSFNPDPLNNEYFLLSKNTSEAITTGLKLIDVSASLENHTTSTLIIRLYVEDRATTLNNQTSELYFGKGIYVQDTYNFQFEYRDFLTKKKLSDIDVKSYSYWKTDSAGNPTGVSGTGTLSEDSNHNYILDFNTENLPVSRYLITISLQKDNYNIMSATIILVVNIRIFNSDLDATNLEDDLISVVHGEDIEFEISLIDTTRDIPLTGAFVEIEIGDDIYDMTEESPGVYTYTFETDDVDAFFTSKTYTVKITINKVYFANEEIELTLEVTMEEIYDGMPTFYFLMIACAIIGIIGSLSSYRIIQQARIPKFVKKIRSIKKSIKGKHSIKSMYIPSKADMFYKEYGKEWKEIGLSLEDILGVKDKKTKLLDKAKSLIKPEEGEQ